MCPRCSAQCGRLTSGRSQWSLAALTLLPLWRCTWESCGSPASRRAARLEPLGLHRSVNHAHFRQRRKECFCPHARSAPRLPFTPHPPPRAKRVLLESALGGPVRHNAATGRRSSSVRSRHSVAWPHALRFSAAPAAQRRVTAASEETELTIGQYSVAVWGLPADTTEQARLPHPLCFRPVRTHARSPLGIRYLPVLRLPPVRTGHWP